MKLSIGIFYDELHILNPNIYPKSDSNDMIYTGLQLYSDDIQPLEQHLLLIDLKHDYENIPTNISGLIFIGEPDFFISEEYTYLTFPLNTSCAKLLTEFQKVFLKYNRWSESLYELIENNSTVQMLCDTCSEIFENPLIVYDDNLLVTALSNEMPGLPDWDYDAESDKKTFPLEILNDFKLDTEFQKSMSTKGSHFFTQQILRGLYNNLWVDGKYSGRVCIHELGREIQLKDYALLEYLTEIISTVLEKSGFHKSSQKKLMEQSLIDIIEGNKINELFFIERLGDSGWAKNDEHVCISISIEQHDSMTSSLKYTCSRLENNFQNSFVFPYKESILMIINLTKTQKTFTELMSELKIFLREGLFRAGISNISNDFFKIRESYIQTIYAIKAGEKVDPMYWYFHFSDYSVQSMFYEISKNVSATMYCNDDLFKLQRYDQKNDTELFETLKILLNSNMNIAHTSERLFIHRSTMLYRLERITSLIHSDLKNPKDRFKLLLSYYLLEWNDKNKKI